MLSTSFAPSTILAAVELLLSNKNERLSKENDARFGTNGSLSICPSNNTFYDHEAGEGGGLLDFVVRHSGTKNHRDAAAWLEAKGLIAGQTMPVAPSTKPTPTAPKKASLGPVIARYDYQGEDGAVLFQVRRHEPKDFRQYGFVGGEWVPTVKGIKQVPYRLPQLLAAPIDAIIYIVEGEKDADRLVRLGLFATTCAGGAGKWASTHSEYFAGRRAIIIPDNDKAGRDHAQQVAQSLSGIAASVGVLALPGLPEKGDVSDWLNAGGTVEELALLDEPKARLTAGFESLEPNPFDYPPAYTQLESSLHPLARFITLHSTPKAAKWVIPGLIEHGVVTIAGARGVGKTTAILPLALAAAGLHAPDYKMAPKSDRWRHVIYISEHVEQVERIIAGVVECSGWGITWDDIAERLHVVEAKRLPIDNVVDVAGLYKLLTRIVDGVEILPLVVFDTQAACFTMSNENDNSEASAIMAALKQQGSGN